MVGRTRESDSVEKASIMESAKSDLKSSKSWKRRPREVKGDGGHILHHEKDWWWLDNHCDKISVSLKDTVYFLTKLIGKFLGNFGQKPPKFEWNLNWANGQGRAANIFKFSIKLRVLQNCPNPAVCPAQKFH